MGYRATKRIMLLATGQIWEKGNRIGAEQLRPAVRDQLVAEGLLVPVEAPQPEPVSDPEPVPEPPRPRRRRRKPTTPTVEVSDEE